MSRPSRIRRLSLAASVAAATVIPLAVGISPAAAGTLNVSGSSIVVSMRGNGHGHGMSQYGARGAAIAKKSYRQIVAFYYPHATLTKKKWTIIRVRLSTAGTNMQVAAVRGLEVSGVRGSLPTAGVSRYRLLSNAASGTRLQRLPSAKGAHWKTIYGSLPNGAEFHRADWGSLRLFAPNGTSRAYSGLLKAVRTTRTGTGHGVLTVNRVSVENYTAGVVPREMPASWPAAAVDAQAVAARTYGTYEMEHPQSSSYDICDTDSCQVYGGTAAYSSAGHLLWTDDQAAARATAGQVLTYRGAAIFAQFSASNGGWTVDGGQPYLVAKQDPYDDKASGDPYLYYTRRVSVSSVARYYGLAKITKFEITRRDGHGTGGGRAVSGYVTGRTSSGRTERIATTGYNLSSAVGAGTTWITLRNA